MPKAKKRKTPAENQVQYSRSLKNGKGVYRGKKNYKPYKRKSKKSKTIMNKFVNKIDYLPKYKDV